MDEEGRMNQRQQKYENNTMYYQKMAQQNKQLSILLITVVFWVDYGRPLTSTPWASSSPSLAAQASSPPVSSSFFQAFSKL